MNVMKYHIIWKLYFFLCLILGIYRNQFSLLNCMTSFYKRSVSFNLFFIQDQNNLYIDFYDLPFFLLIFHTISYKKKEILQ